MEVISNNYMPGDPRLVQQLVNELKSQGIFDEFRKECFADVDTKPAYQNLRQRVEGSVAAFLKEQTWSPDMNKNQVREQLKKNIYESGYLDTGVERIVDQVVNPKISTVFLPLVEDVVYKYLGIEKRQGSQNKVNINPTDLLPKDLEAVSPESVQSLKHDDQKDDTDTLNESLTSKMDEDESPPFEPLEGCQPTVTTLQEETSMDSELSGISGLQSHESNLLSESKSSQMDWSWQDAQLSQNSSESKLSILTSEEQKSDVNKDFTFLKNIDSDSIIDTNNKIDNETFRTEDSVESMVTEEDDSTFDSQKQNKVKEDKIVDAVITEQKEKYKEKKSVEAKKDEKKKIEEKHSRSSHKSSSKDDKHRKSSSSKDKDKSSSRHSSSSKDRDSKESLSKVKDKNKDESKNNKDKESKSSKGVVEKDRHEKEKTKEKEKEKYSKSKDKEDDKSSKQKYDKDKSKSRKDGEKEKIENDKNKNDREKEKSSKDKYDKQKSEKEAAGKEKTDKERERSKDRSEKNKSDKLKDKTKRTGDKSDKNDKKDRDRSKSSGSTIEKTSSNSSSNITKESSSSSSSKKRESHKDSKSADRHKKDKHSKDKSSELSKDKKRDSKKDDHYSSKDKKNHRRSFDRDSNDGQSGKSSTVTTSENRMTNSQQNNKDSSSTSLSGSGDSGNSDAIEKASESQEKQVVPNEMPPAVEIPKMKYIKPKFALNFEEAKRIMKIRRQLAILERQNQLSLADLNIVHNGFGQTKIKEVSEPENEKVKIPDGDDDETPKTSPFRGFDKDSEKSLTKNSVVEPKPKITAADLNLQSIFLSKENWEALEARLEQEMLKINFNAYESHYDDYDDGECTAVTVSPMKDTSVRNSCVIEEFKPRRITEDTGNGKSNNGNDEIGVKPLQDGETTEVNVVNDEEMCEVPVESEQIIEEIVEIGDQLEEMDETIIETEEVIEEFVEANDEMNIITESDQKNDGEQEIINNHKLDKKELSVRLLDIGTENTVVQKNNNKKIRTARRTAIVKDKRDSETDICTHFEKCDDSVLKQLEILHKFINKLENNLEYSIKEYQNNILPEQPVKVVKRGRKRKIDENVDVKNNNSLNYAQTPVFKKRGRGRPPSSGKLLTPKPDHVKSCNSTDVLLNENFSMPLSPAEGETFVDKKEVYPVTPFKQRRISTPRMQRYTSDDLYKPRPAVLGTRRSKREKTQ